MNLKIKQMSDDVEGWVTKCKYATAFYLCSLAWLLWAPRGVLAPAITYLIFTSVALYAALRLSQASQELNQVVATETMLARVRNERALGSSRRPLSVLGEQNQPGRRAPVRRR